MDCVICCNPIKPLLHPTTGEVVWEHGNNAEPVALGRCCDDCNWSVVMETRFNIALRGYDAGQGTVDLPALREAIEARVSHRGEKAEGLSPIEEAEIAATNASEWAAENPPGDDERLPGEPSPWCIDIPEDDAGYPS